MATITGTAGNETLNGTTAADQIYGLGGNDTLNGNAGNDLLDGGDGNDTMVGGAGADQLIGGNGTDTASYAGATAGVTINLKTGVHTGDAAGDTFSSIEAFIGSSNADVFIPDAAAHSFHGSSGTDTVDYSGSTAAINVNLTTGIGSGGDAEGDTFTAIEIVKGSAFADTLGSSTSGHTLQGGAGDDVYIVGHASVTVTEAAGGGNDEIRTTLATYSIASIANIERLTFTGTANATLTGNAENNVITGGSGNDTLNGGAGADILIGGVGNDTLVGGAGADQHDGGDGTDTVSYQGSTTGITLNLKTGVHTGDAAGDTFTSVEGFLGTNYNDVFVASSAAEAFNGATGTDVVDYSTSTSGVTVNLLTGTGSGGDAEGDSFTAIERIVGSAYADTLTSSTSGHTLQGGAGDDVYVVGHSGVIVTEAAGGGNDEIQTTVANYSLDALPEIERLTFLGTAGTTLTGNAANNVITGGIGNDTLVGAAGADQLIGGAGNDTLNGGTGADQLVGGDGVDTATYAGATAAITINLKTGIHAGDAAGDTFSGIEGFIGSNYADVFVAGTAAHAFNGATGIDTVDYSTSISGVTVNLVTGTGSGGDAEGDSFSSIERIVGSTFGDTLSSSTSGHTLLGGAGDDVYVVGNSGVVVTEAAGEGDDEIQTTLASYSMASIANVERLTYIGTGNATLTGSNGDNVITGGTGNDVISGGAGHDELVGGGGNDTLQGEAGNDRLIGGAGDDTLRGGDGADEHIGGDGVDIASYSNSTGGVTINLQTGVNTGDATGDTFVGIEGYYGTAYNDVLFADADAQSFNGNGGTDTIDYSGSSAGVNVSLVTGVGSGGDAEGDTYTSVERVVGSGFGDTLASSASGHTLQGGAGDDVYIVGNSGVIVTEAANDGIDEIRTTVSTYSIQSLSNIEQLTYTGTANATLTGNAADNVLTGSTGNDTLLGADGADRLVGGAGNDTLTGGAGADEIIGGDGTDTVNFLGSSTGVTVNLRTGINAGHAEGDTYSGIENFIGTAYNDTFSSDASAHFFDGAGGTNDTIDYSNSTAAVTVNLTTGVGSGGDAQGDTFTAVERVVGSDYADTLTSSTSGHTLQGGVGDDVYIVGNSGVVITEAAGGGDDEIRTSLATYSIDAIAHVERLTFTGTGGAVLTGNTGDNVITGGNGNDTLFGGTGADQLNGGNGTDTASYLGTLTAITLNFRTGTHSGGATGDTFSEIEAFIGSERNDTFISDDTAHSFNGSGGTDTVDYSASEGAVQVNLTAGTGLDGDAEGDTYSSIETVIGSAHADTLASSTANHTLKGGSGDDVYIVGDSGVDIVELAGEGDDEVLTALTTYSIANFANVERLTFTGTTGATLTGNSGDNIITGGNGNDTLIGGAGADRLHGGNGVDTASYKDATAAVTLDLKYGLHAGETYGDIFYDIESFIGSGYDDTFTSDDAAHRFDGWSGTDTIDYSLSFAAVNVDLTTGIGSGGDAQGDTYVAVERVVGSDFNDTLAAATSGRILEGGHGDDIYVVGHTGVSVVEAADQGNDEVRTSLTTFSIAGYANVERLTFTGTAGATLTGNTGDNIITGAGGNDTLNGGAGVDMLIGATGNDILNGGEGADILIGGDGTDTASYQGMTTAITLNFKTGVHSGEATDDTFSGIEIYAGTNFNDTFISDTAAHTFDGKSGIDVVDYSGSASAVNVNLTTGAGSGGDAEGDGYVSIEVVKGSVFSDTLASSTNGHSLEGGLGDDVYVVGHTGVSVVEASGQGDDEVRTSLTTFSIAGYANVERLTFTGTAGATLTGNTSANIITGASGNDTLIGGEGADVLIGGDGVDTASYQGMTTAITLNFKTGVLTGEAEGDTYSGIEVFAGTNFNDTFISDAAAHTFDGKSGIDVVDYSGSTSAVNVNLVTGVGSGGDAQGDGYASIEIVKGSAFADTLVSSTNGHVLEGGSGNDIYVVGHTGVVVVEDGGQGDDEIRTSVSTFSLAGVANIERLTYTGTLNATLTGNADDNVLTGSTGNDTLIGGEGADHFVGGDGTDTASYIDSTEAMIFDLDAGWFSGIGTGDTFTSIEVIAGTDYGDTFIASANADRVNGGNGIDRISYLAAISGITINLSTGTHAGAAAGDVFTNIEIVEGSNHDDTFVGNSSDNIFVGGDGADSFNGNGGTDSVWYLGSQSGIVLDLATGALSDGDALGDVFTSIERFTGSHFDDTLIANVAGSWLAGGGGNDTIYGGDGVDVIFGGLGAVVDAFDIMPGGNQADVIYGGAGNDEIYSTGHRQGTQFTYGVGFDGGTIIDGGEGNDRIVISSATAYGGSGVDEITVYGSGIAYGGSGNDLLKGEFREFQLYGGDGNDTLFLTLGKGFADGGEGNDVYNTNTILQSTIRDTGTGGQDSVFLERVASQGDLIAERVGDDLILASKTDQLGGVTYENSVVIMQDWFNGYNTIENFVFANNDSISGDLIF